MDKYIVVNYDDRSNDDNEIEIKHVTDDFDYANKLAFHHAKKGLPPKNSFCRTECRIIKDYYNQYSSSHLHHTVVDYRICEVLYDDECEEYEKYDITEVWNNVWAVIKIYNEIENVEDIDETLIYEDNKKE